MKASVPSPRNLLVTLCTSLLIGLASCDKEATVIEPDQDAYKTLIISKGKNNPFGREALEATLDDDDYYSLMWIIHSKGEQSFLPVPDSGGIWGGEYNDALVQLWSVKDRQNFSFADLGTVELGATTIPLWQGGGIVKYEIGGELRELTHYYQIHQEEGDDDPFFVGNTCFSITNSPDIQDVALDLDLPEKNTILNVTQGQVVDPNRDWVIRLKHPLVPEVDGLLMYERSDTFITNQWPNQFEGVSHLIIQAAEATNVLRIPSQDLQELQRNSSVNLYTLSLNPSTRLIAKVPLLRPDGTASETLTIASVQYHLVEFSFQP